MIKLVYVVNVEDLNNGKQTQGAFLNNGKIELCYVMRDKEGVIRRVINTSTKAAYTAVKPYINKATDLNLNEKETKAAMSAANGKSAYGIIEVFRSSGAKEGDTTLTREEQVKQGLARIIQVSVQRMSEQPSTNPLDFKYEVVSDTGASFKLEGEYTL